jgi:hypothetical protein
MSTSQKSRKRPFKSTLVVHKTASSLQRTKASLIAQQKHISFALKRNRIHVSASYVDASSKTTSPPVLEEPAPISQQWMDDERVLWESIMSPHEPPMTEEVDDSGMSLNMPIHLREAYLEEVINHEGRGYDAPDQCPNCCNGLATYQCRSCFGQDLFCQVCVVRRHAQLPFHRIRVSQFYHIIYLRSNWKSSNGMESISSQQLSKASD